MTVSHVTAKAYQLPSGFRTKLTRIKNVPNWKQKFYYVLSSRLECKFLCNGRISAGFKGVLVILKAPGGKFLNYEDVKILK